MEAIIRTNDRNLFESLLQFLRTLHITVETKEEKKLQSTSNQITKKIISLLHYGYKQKM